MKKKPFNKITIHCSATKPSHDTTAADVRQMHLNRGWRDIGYHWFIRRDGTIEAGRSETETGAHVYGHNRLNLGVCMAGGIAESDGTPEDNFTDAQWDSLTWLVDEKRSEYGIKLEDVKGHRDYSPDLNGDGVISPHEFMKACPCFDVKSWLAQREE